MITAAERSGRKCGSARSNRKVAVKVLMGLPSGAVATGLADSKRAGKDKPGYASRLTMARFESASPVATAPLGSPIKTFTATFRLERADPHFLPDLSAAVIIQPPGAPPAGDRK